MDRALRRTALRNAAKVAFGSLLVGCGGVIDTGDNVSNPLPLPDAAPTKPDTDAPTEVLACTGPVDVDASTVDETAFQCCLGVEQALLGDASPWAVDAGAVTGDPSAENCCNAIIAHVDHTPSDYAAAGEPLQLCCAALHSPMGPACTPWGPPTPPAMPELHLDAVA